MRITGVAVAAPLALLATATLLDAALGLPTLLRALVVIGVLALAGYLGYRLVRVWRSSRLTEAEAALEIERATPGGIQNRLINSIQLAGVAATGDADLATAVVNENCAALAQAKLAPTASVRPALIPAVAAALLILASLAVAAFAPERFAHATNRMFRPFAGSGVAPQQPIADGTPTAETDATLTSLRVTLTPPAYTGQPARTVEVAGGDLEALAGTTAEVVFTFDQPTDSATIHLQGKPAAKLDRMSATEFRGTFAFTASTGYRLETRRGGRAPHTSGLFVIRVLPDLPPRLELTGLAGMTDPPLEAKLAVTVRATDDYGLAEVGIFARPVGTPAGQQPDEGWAPVQVWAAGGKSEFRQPYELSVQSLGGVEGSRLEVALRGRDTNPANAKLWTTGPSFTFTVGGEGAALQVQYEQILRTEAELKAILAAQRELEEKSAAWLKKLDAGSGIRWDDMKNVDELHAALTNLAKEQRAIQTRATAAARGMLPLAGNLKISVELLAQAEMTRAIRALDAVAGQEQPKKRAGLGDARVTQTRTARSLAEMLDHYVSFRHDWEAENAVPFLKMLAERQAALRDESQRYTQVAPPSVNALVASRRQSKVGELANLFAPALLGAGERLAERDADLAAAFNKASAGLKAEPLMMWIGAATAATREGRWGDAVPPQTEAARHLAAVHEQLRKALEDAARKALQALVDKAKSDVEAQKAIEKLKAGTDKTFIDLPAKLDLTDVKHLQDVAQKGMGDGEKLKPDNYLFPDSAKGILQQPDTGKRQQFDILKLANSPGKTPSFPKQSDREANTVKPHIQEKFDDLVGKLLEEADEINEKYETYNLNAGVNINEPGEIGKQAGDLNSTAAAAATGNMKPPTTNVGGATRSGRQGARAHGMTVGDESLNRRGRDKVQEGQDRVGDQAGTMKQKLSDDPQKDTSTGVGGKKVETDDAKFSVADKGKWTDDMAKRLDKPQAKQFIVERQDGKLDPKIGEMFRDLNSRQEQLIERVKALKKELRNLYLPTEHLDDIEAQLQASLDRLKERPDAEAFRQHLETLDKLRAAVRVFQAPAGGWETGTPRDRAVKGRALDAPARPPLPGYEEPTKRYYEQLSK